MKTETEIDIEKSLSPEERITREGGEKLRRLILSGNLPVAIDFKNKPIASVSFWDESIAKLLIEGWTEKEIRQKVILKNAHPRDQEIIGKLIQARLKNLGE